MSTPLGPPTGTYAPPTDMPAEPVCATLTIGGTTFRNLPDLTCPTDLTALPLPVLLAMDEEYREAISGAERAEDLGRARALFLERLGVGREIAARRAVALADQQPMEPLP